MKTLNKIISKLPQFFTSIYFVLLLFCLLICAFIVPFYSPIHFPDFTSLNYVYFAISFVLFVVLYFVVRKLRLFRRNINNKIFVLVVVLTFVALIVFQIYMITRFIYVPIGDTNAITGYFFQVSNFVPGQVDPCKENMDLDLAYNLHGHLSTHRNLMFIAGVFMRFYNFMNSIGFQLDPSIWSSIANVIPHPEYFSYFLVAEFLSCICIDISILLIVLLIKKTTNNVLALVCLLICALLTGISPNTILVYTDPYSMLIISSILFVFVCVKNKWIKLIYITFAFFIGYAIKPTTVAVTFAILFVCVITKLAAYISKKQSSAVHKSKKRKQALSKKDVLMRALNFVKMPAVFVCVAFLTVLLVNKISNFGVETNQEMQLPVTHYLMLGSNNVNDGRYFQGDELYTDQFNTNEKQDANLQVVKKRIEKRGFAGTFDLLAKKAMIAYGTGTFIPKQLYFFGQIGNEDPFITSMYGIYSAPTLDFMGEDSGGDYFTIYNIMAQIIWFFVLISAVCLLYKKTNNKSVHIISLSMLMISIFLLLFEANERYLFLYSLFPVVLCIYYWADVAKNSSPLKFPINIHF